MQYNSLQQNIGKIKLLKILFIFLVILLVLAFFFYFYFQNKKPVDNNSIFFDSLANNDLDFFLENDLVEKIFDKTKQRNFSLSSNVILSNTVKDNVLSKFDLTKFEFLSNYLKGKNEKNLCITANYLGNELLKINFLSTFDKYALKVDNVTDKYIGLNKENYKDVLKKISNQNNDFSYLDDIKEFINNREKIDISLIKKKSALEKYFNALIDETKDCEISIQDNIAITQNNNQISVTEYTLKVDNKKFSNILKQISKKIESDDELIEIFNTNTIKIQEMLDYRDNENVIEIPAIEKNFNASSFVWNYLNNQNETTDLNNIITDNNTSNNNVPENRTEVTNNIINTNITENTINNEVINIVNPTENHINIIVEPDNEEIQEENSDEVIEVIDNTQDETSIQDNSSIELRDSIRLQGYISMTEITDEEDFFDDDNTEFVIGENYEETLDNIEKMIKKLNWKSYLLTGAKSNIPNEEFILMIKEYLNEIIKNNCSLVIKAYVNNKKTIRIDLFIPEVDESVSIEIVSLNEKEKYLNTIYLKGEDSNVRGRSISFYKKDFSAKKTYTLNIDEIINQKISQKNRINFEITGKENDSQNNIIFDISHSDNNGTIKVESNNNLRFNDIIESIELSESNCIFLDRLLYDELISVKDEMKNKFNNFIRSKNKEYNIFELSEEKNLVEQISENGSIVSKEEIETILINTIADKMRAYLDTGNILKLEDLADLAIEGHNVQVSINTNLAIIVIDGYRFTLDRDFYLYNS